MTAAPQAAAGGVVTAPTLGAMFRDLAVFPTRKDVELAAAMFPAERQPDVHAGQHGYWDWLAETKVWVPTKVTGRTGDLSRLVEGPRFFVDVAPGVIAVRSTDWARADRKVERNHRSRAAAVAQLVADWKEGRSERARASTGRRITSWSRRSRNLMQRRLGELDYSPMLADGGVPAMLTLTYPDQWQVVAPNARETRRQLGAFRRRFERATGRPMCAVWKREFQRRGAPHFHLLMVPPKELGGMPFEQWAALTWAAVVAHPDAEERAKHERWGASVDYHQGARVLDPVRLARYFLKHGVYAAKDYQNEAPREWLHEAGCVAEECSGCSAEGVGAYWRQWGLKRAVCSIPLAPDTALALARTLRRYKHGDRYQVPTQVTRRRLDVEQGQILGRYQRPSTRTVRPTLRGHRGYLLTTNGPHLAGQTARYLTILAAGHRHDWRERPPLP